MKCVVHVEIIRVSGSQIAAKELEYAMLEELQSVGFIRPGCCLTVASFTNEILRKHVLKVRFSEISELQYRYHLELENLKKLSLEKVTLQFHTYYIEEEEIQSEELQTSDSLGGGEAVSAANHCLLPHITFDGMWESLIFDNNVKEILLEYASTSMIFSQREVNTNVICWNRVILLYGPPGTGKTSLCKALAQKLSIRLRENYKITEFIEINSHSLFSKYYSESGKLVMGMFSKIKEHLDYGESFVCVLIDEIESLTRARKSCSNGEPSDSIRVVNAVLTQLDHIRKYPNVLILTTSNLKSAIDMAFVDRADLQIYIGPPSVRAIYDIFVSCLEELSRVNIISSEKTISFLPSDCVLEIQEKKEDMNVKLLDVAKLCEGLSGRILRKLPFLAYSYFCGNEDKSVSSYIYALQQAVNQYRTNNENIYNVH